MIETKLLINGEAVAATKGATFERIDPVTGDVATRAAAASAEDAIRAVEAASAAFPEWAAMGPVERRGLLQKAANVLREKSAEFASRVREETGSTEGWGHFNVFFASSLLDEAAAMTTQISGEIIPANDPDCMAMGIRQPAGVVFGMAPWNAPVILGVRALAMPLACGNTVVLKASEICPATHLLIGEALGEAGIPPGVVNVISHTAEDAPAVVEAVIAHPAVRRVNFTGSTRVGRIIGEMCGRHLKPSLLELGGKAPLIVLDDADLDEAVAASVFGAFMNQGQICMSTERIILDKSVADAFIEKFSAKAGSLTVGNPHEGQFALGAVVSTAAAERVKALTEDAVSKGATLIGGEADGTILSPAILDNVTSDMRIYSEESFGPVVAVMRVDGVEEAIASANDTEYGLAASVFGKDIGRAMAVARRIESGICHVNGPTVHDEGQMPFGGTKASGYGRFGGKAAIDEFTELRWITVETKPRHYPI